MGIDANLFVGMPQFLKCPVCLDVLEDPAMTLCGHTCCFFCWYSAACRSLLSPKMMSCPLCRKQYNAPILLGYSTFINRTLDRVLVNNYIAREMINDSMTQCHWSGWSKNIKYSEKERHASECPIFSKCSLRYTPIRTPIPTIRVWRVDVSTAVESRRGCSICERGFDNYSEFRRHMDSAHLTGVDDNHRK